MNSQQLLAHIKQKQIAHRDALMVRYIQQEVRKPDVDEARIDDLFEYFGEDLMITAIDTLLKDVIK